MSFYRRGLPSAVRLAFLVQLPVEGRRFVKGSLFGLAVLGTLPLQRCQPLLLGSPVALLRFAETHARLCNLSFIALPAKPQDSRQTARLRRCKLLPARGRFRT